MTNDKLKIKYLWRVLRMDSKELNNYNAIMKTLDEFNPSDHIEDKDLMIERLKDLTDKDQILCIMDEYINKHR